MLPNLLLSDGTRLLTLNPNALLHTSNSIPSSKYVVADYQLGDQFGKLAYADFLLGDAYVLVIYEMGHASILSLLGPQREDIPCIKFGNHQGIAVAPSGKAQALLLRSKGQDQIAVVVNSEDGIKIQSTFPTHTFDAQGVAWSPDCDPVIAVWDSASHGVKVCAFSALGHPLKQLELCSLAGPEAQAGVGVTAFKWVKDAEGTLLAVADGHKQVMLRRQHVRTMVSDFEHTADRKR